LRDFIPEINVLKSKLKIMKMNKLHFAAAFILLAGFTACKKSKDPSSFNYKLTTTSRSNVLARVEAGNITWASGYANANMVKFEAKTTSNTAVEFKSPVSQQLDIFASLASTLTNVTLTPGTYHEIEFKAELAPGGSNAALEINGTFTSGVNTTPVLFTVGSPLEIKTEMSNVTVTDNSSYSAITSLNLSLLTRGITEAMLNSATKTNGKIVISATSNAGLFATMLANLDGCDEMDFHHD
jgi:hypothetical protein